MLEVELGERLAVLVGHVGRAVVGHDSAYRDASLGEPVDRSSQERDGTASGQGGQHLGVGQARMVVDHDVDVFEAGRARSAVTLDLALAMADHPMASTPLGDAAQL